jgi:tetratricopeptide (TPR) repeat protein
VRHYYPPAVRYRYGAPYCYPGYGYSYSYNYGYGFPISWTTTLPIGFGIVPVGGFGGGAVRDEGSIALLRQNADLGSDIYSPSRSTLPPRPLATSPAPVAGQGLFASQETQTVVDLVARVAESVRDSQEARGVASDGNSLADREAAAPRRPLLAAAARALAGSGRLAEAPADRMPLETRGDDSREGGVRESGVRENGGRESAIRDGEQAGNVPQASSDAARRRAAKYVQQGDQLFARGRYLEAMSVYQRAAESTPDAAQPLVRQGLAYLAAKRYERAADVIRRGLRLEPDYAASGFRLRHLYGGDSVAKSEHLEALAAAANADPGNSDLPLLAAIFLHYDGQSERAEPFFAESRQRGGEAAQFVALFK